MSLRIFLISLTFILPAQFCVYGFQNDYSYEVKGRVIDDYSKPVAGASIRVKFPGSEEGCIINTETTDVGGNFTIKRQFREPASEWIIFAVDYSPVLRDTHDLLGIGNFLDTEYYSFSGGQKIIAVENQVTNLGDIRLQYRQYPVLIQLLDSDGKPLIKETEDDEYGFAPWWIVRDPRGDIISEGGNGYDSFRFSESAVMTALPEGNWQLDISESLGSGFKASQIITVKPSGDVQKFTLKLKKSALKFEGRKKSFPYTARAARQKIERMGFAFTQESFENRVLNGNDKVVALFLNAGMDPNVLTKELNFITDSVFRPQVLKVLLEAGANVNGKAERGITPLIAATGSSLIPLETIKMILDAGADIEAKDDEGHDSFYYSNKHPEVVELLKSYAAKKKMK
ncbi:MAG TPA: hypothetical protein VGB00_13760 [Pyrinomonadaceae bacterium]|jgi:hypothetical protein